MPDIASISTALGAIKTATEIAKAIRESEFTLKDAEIKLRFAELITALADTKIAVAEAKETIESKDSEINSLKEALIIKEKLKFNGKFYFMDGDPTPFCPRCWEKEKSTIHLAPEICQGYIYTLPCPHCKTEYKTRDVDLSPRSYNGGHY